MTSWNEDNFLERLMPRPRRENGVQMEPCPDSELLSAFTEQQVSPFLRDAIAAHLAQCPKCQDIYERLRQFAKGTILGRMRNGSMRRNASTIGCLASCVRGPTRLAQSQRLNLRLRFCDGRASQKRLFPGR